MAEAKVGKAGGSETGKLDFSIETLGNCNIRSPITMSRKQGGVIARYVTDNDFIRMNVNVSKEDAVAGDDLLQRAGPREMIYFMPEHVHAGIVSCGGLCPGINDVIRSIVRCLWYHYRVRRITGIRYGYRGFLPQYTYPTVDLNMEWVDNIHKIGGTVLGSSRGGGKEVEKIVDSIEQLNLNILFTIGGDGTQRGSLEIAEEIEKRNLKIASVGIPKTVDNDFSFIQKSFGFDTAVAKAVEVVACAHMEASSQPNGIGLVKLMGRESGFIAVHTALASHEANFVLIPEVPFDLQGPNGFLEHLEKRLKNRNHAVIIVAEGALQDQLIKEHATDASGNVKMVDVGIYIKEQIKAYFKSKGTEVTLKYIDPILLLRSIAIRCARRFPLRLMPSTATVLAMPLFTLRWRGRPSSSSALSTTSTFTFPSRRRFPSAVTLTPLRVSGATLSMPLTSPSS
jgi:6-phosphofructokinase 1